MNDRRCWLMLDVDGTLSPLETPTEDHLEVSCPAGTARIRLGTIRALSALPDSIRTGWYTGWGEYAPQALGPHLLMDDCGWIEPDPMEPDPSLAKYLALVDALGEDDVCAVLDDAPPEVEVDRRIRFFPVDQRVGMTSSDLASAVTWLETGLVA